MCPPMGEGRGRERHMHIFGRGSRLWALFFKSFLSVLQGGNLRGEDLRGRFSRIVISSQVCPFRVQVSTDWSGTEQRVTSHHSWSWPHPPGFAAFLGLGLQHSWSLDVVSREDRSGEGLICRLLMCLGRKGHPGAEVLVFPDMPLARSPGLSALVAFCT